MNEGWIRKRELASGVTSSHIDSLYETAMQNGAKGGKLLGAGGGGFLLVYCDEELQPKLEKSLNIKRFPFSFEYDGTSVVYIGDKYW